MTKSDKRTILVLLTIFLVDALSVGIIFSDKKAQSYIFGDREAYTTVVNIAPEGVRAAVASTKQDVDEEYAVGLRDAVVAEIEAREAAAEAERQRIAAEEAAAEAARQAAQAQTQSQPVSSGGSSFRSDGVWYDGQFRYTWYSSNVLYHYRTPEWSAGADGIYRDSEGYVVVASSDHPQGTIISNTPFGAAKVYDTGCASGTLDVYTNY